MIWARRVGSGTLGTLLLLWVPVLDLPAQTPPAEAGPVPTGGISGTVLDQDGWRPVQGARVRLLDLDGMVRTTDESGRFRFADVPSGIQEIEIQHIAYGRGTHLINVLEGETVHLEARLEESAIALEEMVITANVSRSRLGSVGFLDRQRRGWGHFFQGDDADAWGIRRMVASVPGARFQQGRGAFDRRVVFRRGVRDCSPEIYVDRVLQRWAGGNVEDVVTGLDIEGIEIYRGTETPMEFQTLQYPPCGAIVIWTRR
jgi:hypothetical protein